MAKKQPTHAAKSSLTQPKIFEATIRKTDGAVVKGREITRAQADKGERLVHV